MKSSKLAVRLEQRGERKKWLQYIATTAVTVRKRERDKKSQLPVVRMKMRSWCPEESRVN